MQKRNPRIWGLGRKGRPALDPGEADRVLKKRGKGRGLQGCLKHPLLEKQRPGCTGKLHESQENKAPHTVVLAEGLQSGTV